MRPLSSMLQLCLPAWATGIPSQYTRLTRARLGQYCQPDFAAHSRRLLTQLSSPTNQYHDLEMILRACIEKGEGFLCSILRVERRGRGSCLRVTADKMELQRDLSSWPCGRRRNAHVRVLQ
ncbi:hypothetical protein BD310DRAFT_939757 [Dichomitus squalens]|uniref:Uncharacterized protein n=1 Tax=Dichomitus squalens TaxID=114155 RepID=A0A4V2K6L5_9APHY|nr:hypothetical protein BD310DRAFT_939757 [Dichomitus squalens]